MSIASARLVWDHSKSRGAAFTIMLAIADWVNDKFGYAWPSIDAIAAKARVSPRHVQTELEHLQEIGELMVQYGTGPNGTNRYFVTIQPQANQAVATQEPQEWGARSTDADRAQSLRNSYRTKRTNTKPAARSQSSRAGGGKYWGDGCPEFPVRIDSAGSPRPPKRQPEDPLMQARAKPKSSAAAGGGPLFGEPEPAKAKTDEIVVREVYAAAYEQRFGIKPRWAGAEAKHAKDLMRMCREGGSKRRLAPEIVLARVVLAFLDDPDPFLGKNAYRFLLLSQRATRYISEVLSLGRGSGPAQLPDGAW